MGQPIGDNMNVKSALKYLGLLGEPHNTITLKSMGLKSQEANMI